MALSFVTAALAAGSVFASTSQESMRVNAAVSHLMAQRTQLGLDADHSFALKLTHSDSLGQTHGHFQQMYKGVRVWGGDVITHTDRNGQALAPTHTLHSNISLNVLPAMSQEEVLAVAHQDLNPKGNYAHTPTAELVVYPEMVEVLPHGKSHINAVDVNHEVLRYTLAYHVQTSLQNGVGETSAMNYIINAHTGAIIKKWNDLHTSAAVGTGNSQYSGVIQINTNSLTSGFELRDMTRGNTVVVGSTAGNAVTNLNHATSGVGTIYADADNTWGDGANYVEGSSTTAANGETAAVDAAYGIQATWDMYKYVLGRNGIDNTGKSSYLRVHYSNSYDNAFWDDTCFCMTFGDGSSFTTLTSVDVAGHEMSHGVIANSVPGGLTYSGESGGLNEANSDNFGTMVEFYDLGGGEAAHATTVPSTGGNWTIGEQLSSTPLRYMYKPSLDGTSPDAWYSGIGSLDVHYSSGPGNRVFYFLSQGASGTSSSNYYSSYTPAGFAGVGNDHATRIHYRAMTTYYTSNETYAACRTAHISAAKDLYGAGSADEQAVWNSFAAINVGAAWTGGTTTNTVTASITTPSSNVTIASGTAQNFVGTATDSSTTATMTYAWTFGDGGTATTASASHTYTNTGSTAVNYTATFKATDNTGATNSVTRTITVNPGATSGTTFYEVETNDTVATANVVARTFTTVQGTLSVATDKDFFALTLNPGEKITVGMTGPTGVDWDLKLVNSAGTQLAISQGSTATESVTYTNAGTTAMTVYANPYVYSGVSTTPYNLALTYSGGSTGGDTTAPTASATESGTSGTITFSATATDNVGVSKVEFYVDGVLKGTDTTSPYSMTLDSTTLTNATHSLTAKAYDAAGNVGTSTAVSFTVSNSTGGTSYTEVESNNTTASANVVADTVTSITGYMGSQSDLDYFKINVAAGRTVTVNMTGPSGVDYDLYLLNSAGTTLKSSLGTTATESVTYTNTGTTTAVYYIKVLAYSGYSTTTPYNLALTR
jgi:Zn-dependent metalloprotease